MQKIADKSNELRSLKNSIEMPISINSLEEWSKKPRNKIEPFNEEELSRKLNKFAKVQEIDKKIKDLEDKGVQKTIRARVKNINSTTNAHQITNLVSTITSRKQLSKTQK